MDTRTEMIEISVSLVRLECLERRTEMKCVTCEKEGAIKARVPWGKNECPECRKKTGNCLICRVNRNDCCC